MYTVTTDSIKPLIQSDDESTLSIYLPTHRYPTNDHIQEDRIRFKNLIRAGKETLESQGVDADIVRKIGNLLEDVYNNDEFWTRTTEGLAVFASLSGVRCYQLPMECDERVSAGGEYDILPLLVILSYNRPYYILALATHEPVLYRGDMYGIQPVEIELPESPEVALNIDELYSNSQTVRAGGGNGPGSPGSGAHGQGDTRQAGQEERLEFFRLVDDTIMSSDKVDRSAALLIAGSENEVGEFRKLSRHKHILDGYLNGNYTYLVSTKPQDVHERSWELIDGEVGHRQRIGAVERFHELAGVSRSSATLSDIKEAAGLGRVETVFMGMLTITRDTVRDGDTPVTKLIFPDGYEPDGLAACARTVYNNGGQVVGLLRDDMPEGATMAALYRY